MQDEQRQRGWKHLDTDRSKILNGEEENGTGNELTETELLLERFQTFTARTREKKTYN